MSRSEEVATLLGHYNWPPVALKGGGEQGRREGDGKRREGDGRTREWDGRRNELYADEGKMRVITLAQGKRLS